MPVLCPPHTHTALLRGDPRRVAAPLRTPQNVAPAAPPPCSACLAQPNMCASLMQGSVSYTHLRAHETRRHL
eukprot:12125368-Prorocentrum_lima.AAC.1